VHAPRGCACVNHRCVALQRYLHVCVCVSSVCLSALSAACERERGLARLRDLTRRLRARGLGSPRGAPHAVGTREEGRGDEADALRGVRLGQRPGRRRSHRGAGDVDGWPATSRSGVGRAGERGASEPPTSASRLEVARPTAGVNELRLATGDRSSARPSRHTCVRTLDLCEAACQDQRAG